MNPEEKDIENPVNQLIRNIHECHGDKVVYEVLADLLGYEKTPPSIEEFVDGSDWLGSVLEDGLYLPWRKALYEIYPNPFYSMYAEICLSGDTKVDLLDGTSRTMLEICKEFTNKKFWVLAYDLSDNSWKPSLAYSPRKTRSNCKVHKITLDNGKSFKATEDHLLLTINNQWKSISELNVGDSLKSYTKKRNDKGYDIIWRHDSNVYVSLHKIIAWWKFGWNKLWKKKQYNVHHKDFNHANNTPENLCVCKNKDHFKYHNKRIVKNYTDPVIRKKMLKSLKAAFKKYWESDIGQIGRKERHIRGKSQWNNLSELEKTRILKRVRLAHSEWSKTDEGKKCSIDKLIKWKNSLTPREYKKILKERASKGSYSFWNDPKHEKIRQDRNIKLSTHMRESGQAQNMSNKFWNSKKGNREKERLSIEKSNWNNNKENQLKTQKGKVLSCLNKLIVKLGRRNITIDSYDNLIEKHISGRKCSLTGIAKIYDTIVDKTVKRTKWKTDVIKLSKKWESILDEAENYNHKIISIEFAGYEDVYNFEVEKYYNFPLSCGVISHNCLSGGIGTGKTSCGLIGALYDLTRIALLKEPQEHFNLLSTTKIAYTILNRTLISARDILYDQIKDMVASSPILYEMHRKAYKEKRSIKTLFPNNIDLLTASRAGHALGAAICGAVLDELNFQDNAYKNYLAIKRRIQSRFLQPGGHYPSRVWMLSSKDKHSSFLEDHIRENITNPITKVYEYSIWEIQKHKKSTTGKSIYCGKTFKVFCGDAVRDPRILKGKGDSIGLDASRVIDVPIEYYNDFKKDIYNSLRELAGKSTDSVFKYISSVELIDKALKLTNPVHREEIILDFNNRSEKIIDYIDIANLITPQYPYNHRHIHIDMALGKKDRLGIASTFIASVSNTFKRDDRTGLEIPVREPFYITELLLAIKAKSGSEIPLYKIKEFISTLINSYSYPLTKVTTDGFQSSSLLQDLNIMGINAEYCSVDRTKEPYEILKQALLGGKWLCVKSSILNKELRGLVDTGKKVDHVSDGSKDCSDACAGSVAQCYYTYVKYPQVISDLSVPAS